MVPVLWTIVLLTNIIGSGRVWVKPSYRYIRDDKLIDIYEMTSFPAELFISLHNKHVYTTRKIHKIVWHDLLHWICQQKHMWKKLQWFPFHLKPTDIICIYVVHEVLEGRTGLLERNNRGTEDVQQRYIRWTTEVQQRPYTELRIHNTVMEFYYFLV